MVSLLFVSSLWVLLLFFLYTGLLKYYTLNYNDGYCVACDRNLKGMIRFNFIHGNLLVDSRLASVLIVQYRYNLRAEQQHVEGKYLPSAFHEQ